MKMSKERYDAIYRQVNAMYYENYSIKDIVSVILSRNGDLCDFHIIDIIQAVDARNKIKEEAKYKRAY